MLKRYSETQPVGRYGDTARARRVSVRIDGVTAPRHIRIGLVPNRAGGSVVAAPPPACVPTLSSAATGAASHDVSPAGSPVLHLLAGITQLALRGVAALIFGMGRMFRQFWRGMRCWTGRIGNLSRLSLAAAVLSVAMAALLHAQFSRVPAMPMAVHPASPTGGPALPGTAYAAAVADTARPATWTAASAPQGQVPLGAAAAAAATPLDGDALVARMTAGTLAALRSSPSQPGPTLSASTPGADEGSALFRMVRTAAAQGQSEAYIHQLVNAAYQQKKVAVPASLIRADGEVDTATILALFVGN
ncbi:hypothetical protein [Leisingera sp.]|uniref:hypothetical protein n=1 Tax=Leisingera sp. TaxID=1879318 RepID=UPI003A8CD851